MVSMVVVMVVVMEEGMGTVTAGDTAMGEDGDMEGEGVMEEADTGRGI